VIKCLKAILESEWHSGVLCPKYIGKLTFQVLPIFMVAKV